MRFSETTVSLGNFFATTIAAWTSCAARLLHVLVIACQLLCPQNVPLALPLPVLLQERHHAPIGQQPRLGRAEHRQQLGLVFLCCLFFVFLTELGLLVF